MDCVTTAASLRKLLIAHSQAGRQVSALEIYRLFFLRRLKLLQNEAEMSDVSQQSLSSALEGNKSQDLHLSLRLSVCEGVRLMYNNYQNKKWAQVQETARSIIQNLGGATDTEQTTVTSLTPGGSTSVDKAAEKWSLAYCEFYRDN